MKRILFFLSVITYCHAYSQVQGLTQSADGKSTIPIRGSAIAVDLAQTELSVGYNNINQSVKSKNIKPVYGLSVKVKNEEGIANLFSSGDLVPSGSGTAMLGITFSNAFNAAVDANLDRRTGILNSFNHWQTKFRADLTTDFKAHIKKAVAHIPTGANHTSAESFLNSQLAAASGNEETFYDKIKSKTDGDETVQAVYDEVISFAKLKADEYTRKKTDLQDKLGKLYEEYSDISFQRFTIYGFGGISALSFKQFTKIDSSNLSKSFTNVDQRGGNIGLGINYQWRMLWLGATYSYTKTNNFEELKKKEYTLRTTTSLDPRALIDETKITAYSGKYGEVEVNNLDIDIVARVKLDKESKNYVLINPYLRSTLFSRDTSLLQNKMNIGLGLYLFPNNGKFIGGLYFELPDMNNNVEKAKPVDEQNLRPPFKRLSFGVVAKFNISTLVGW